MLNVVALTGRLTENPELKYTPQGTAVCSFDVAVERSYAKQGEARQTDFIHIVTWRGTAEFVSQYFRKGQMMALQGSIQTRSYTDSQGNSRKAFEVMASQVSFCGPKAPEQPAKPQNQPRGNERDNRIDEETYDPRLDDDLPF